MLKWNVQPPRLETIPQRQKNVVASIVSLQGDSFRIGLGGKGGRDHGNRVIIGWFVAIVKLRVREIRQFGKFFKPSPNDHFVIGSSAVGGTWNRGGPLSIVNSILPLRPILPPAANSRQGGLLWNFGSVIPVVTFNAVGSFIANNGVAAVPERSVLAASVMGVSAFCFERRNKRSNGR